MYTACERRADGLLISTGGIHAWWDEALADFHNIYGADAQPEVGPTARRGIAATLGPVMNIEIGHYEMPPIHGDPVARPSYDLAESAAAHAKRMNDSHIAQYNRLQTETPDLDAMPRDQARESIAQALYAALPAANRTGPWGAMPEPIRDVYRREADAILAANNRP
jgi:hypothetical protein